MQLRRGYKKGGSSPNNRGHKSFDMENGIENDV